jgi:hypothetical protein
MTWKWKGGTPNLATNNNTPATLQLTAGYNYTPNDVPRLEVHDSFRTLGIRISPSGSQKAQIKVLCAHTDSFSSAVSGSSFSPDKAYWAYMLYLWPRLTYPLPCTSLAEKQCRYIQTPAIAALLPKLHLNRHTSHALVFGDYKYGGIGLPAMYADQGFQQLKYLLGHLQLQDDVGKLILIHLSKYQLTLGINQPFLLAPFSHYAKFVDNYWLSSMWQ